MRNQFLDARTAADIDQRIQRIHVDLGHRDRPVDLAAVRDLLRLDLKFYRADDPRLSEQVVHKLKIGANRVARGPRVLLDVVKKLDLRALLLSKEKRILLDATLPPPKQRWTESHEIAHSVIPWHDGYTLGDDRSTLSPACHKRIEAEANYGAGRLLFPAQPFEQAAASSQPSMEHVRALATHFGNSITTALWRYVEHCAGYTFGVIGQHPRHPQDGEPTVAHLILSPKVAQEFPGISEAQLYAVIGTYCSWKRGGPLGKGALRLTDANGDGHEFRMDSFDNRHQVLTLGWK